MSDVDNIYDVLKIGVSRPLDELNNRIEERFIGWLDDGLVDEVSGLRAQGLSWKRIESFGLEYRQVALYLQDKIGEKEMIDRSVSEIKKYAKRQMTWFKRDSEIRWVKDYAEALDLAHKFL